MPTCGSCGVTYHNFQGKHECQKTPPYLRRDPDDGWTTSKGWGSNVQRPVVWRQDPIRSHGKLTYPPDPPEAA